MYIYRRLYGHLHGPISQVLHRTCLKISNFRNVGQVKSHIQALPYQIVPLSSRYIFSTCTRTHLSTIPIKLVFWYLQIFSCLILSIGWYVNYADLGVRLWLSTFRIICPRFLKTGISPEFTWIFINPVCGVFFPGVFSPWPKKKRHLKKNLQKMFVQIQSI